MASRSVEPMSIRPANLRCIALAIASALLPQVAAAQHADEFGFVPSALSERDEPADARAWARLARDAQAMGSRLPAPASMPQGLDAELVDAARAGDAERTKALLDAGANPDVLGADGFTALGAAAFHGHALVVRELLQAGADPDRRGSTGRTPLHLACQNGHETVIDALLRGGADPHEPDRAGRPAPHVAAYHGRIGVLARLQQRGVDLALRDARGLDALHAAALGERVETIDWLLARGLRSSHAVTDLLIERARAFAVR